MHDWITAHKIPLGSWLKYVVDFLNAHAQGFFDFIPSCSAPSSTACSPSSSGSC